MKNLILLLAISFCLFQCKSNPPDSKTTKPDSETTAQSGSIDQQEDLPETPKPREARPADQQSVQPVFDKKINMGKINFDVYAENGETTKIKVKCDGLSARKYNKEFEVEGQLKDAFSLDLNNDGFYELYLVIQQTDDSGNHEIIGIASYNDKSAGEIYVKESKELKMKESDQVYVENGKLLRTFKNEDNTEVTYNYELKKGEAGFILEARKPN